MVQKGKISFYFLFNVPFIPHLEIINETNWSLNFTWQSWKMSVFVRKPSEGTIIYFNKTCCAYLLVSFWACVALWRQTGPSWSAVRTINQSWLRDQTNLKEYVKLRLEFGALPSVVSWLRLCGLVKERERKKCHLKINTGSGRSNVMGRCTGLTSARPLGGAGFSRIEAHTFPRSLSELACCVHQ